MEDRTFIAEDLVSQILAECTEYTSNKVLCPVDRSRFEQICRNLSEPDETGFSKLVNVVCDFLYWYQVQNLFDAYLAGAETPALSVLKALEQMLSQPFHLDYFALVDSLMLVVEREWKKPERNWRVLAQIFRIFDELKGKLVEAKTQLRFLDNIEICLNMPVYLASKTIEELMELVLDNFISCLLWLVQKPTNPDLNIKFKVDSLSADLIEFVMNAFLTMLRDRPFGYKFCPDSFQRRFPPKQVVPLLIVIIKNEHSRFQTQECMTALQILDGLTCLDLINEFKELNEKQNGYFKEICKYFNFYAQTLRTLARVHTQSIVEVPQQMRSQKFLAYFLCFLHDVIDLKTREMEQTLYPQLIEPLVQIITVMPAENRYKINLECQQEALSNLKIITKKSSIFEDSSLMELLIQRLKVELHILEQDLTIGCQYKPSNDDYDVNRFTLVNRQKFIKDLLGMLCYAVIRIDPTRLNQNQNFIAHSRKILESNLFDSLMDFVFIQNTYDSTELFRKVVDPIFLEVVQLYTIIGNDLPQKIGDLIDSGLIPCILESLARRIPIQPQLLPVIIKFFKMLTLNQKGLDAFLASQAIERFFQLGQDFKAYKMFVMPRGSNLMFEQRQLINALANFSLEIAKRIYSQCLKNLEIMHAKSWDLCQAFLQMEQQILDSKAESEEEQSKFKDPYSKLQLNYEQALESSVALLSCLCMDELEYLENRQTHNTAVIQAIKAGKDDTGILLTILRTPIICSAADSFIYHFQESATLILMLQSDDEGLAQYLDQLREFMRQSFQDLYSILGTQDLDSLSELQTQQYVDLAESSANQLQRNLLTGLKKEDVVWVAVSKIHMLIEMVIIVGTLSKFHPALDLDSQYQAFVKKMLEMPIGGYFCVAKLQHFLHRFYSNVYVEKVQQQCQRMSVVDRYRDQLKQYIWGSFRESEEPYSDFEDARNIFYRYELEVVETLRDKRAEDLTRQQFEFVLPETKGVIQTFKCHKKIKNLMAQIAAVLNKKRYHFKDPLTEPQTQYFELSARLICDQLRHIASRCTSQKFDWQQTLNAALMIDRILPELSRQIAYKWKNQINGIFLCNLLNEQQVVDVVGLILEWALQQYAQYDSEEGNKCLFHARNCQIIIKECVQFFCSLLKVTYLCNGNLQSYLAYFKRDKLKSMSKTDIDKNFPKCFTLTKNLLYKCALLPISQIIFSPERQCLSKWHYFQGQISENVIKIYSTLCQGAFKEPFDFFADQNIHKQIRSDLPIRRLRSRSHDMMVIDTEYLLDSNHLDRLVQMGFSVAASTAALTQYHELDIALEALLQGEFNGVLSAPDPEQPARQEKMMDADVMEHDELEQITTTAEILYESDFGPESEPEILQSICHLLRQTLIPCVSEHLSKCHLSFKRSLINKLFGFYKDFKHPLVIEELITEVASQVWRCPDWFFVCFTIQILSYAKEPFVQKLNLTQMFVQLISRLQNLDLSWTKQKVETPLLTKDSPKCPKSEHIIEETSESLYSLHVYLSLLYFLLTDFHSQQEIQTLNSLVNPPQEEKSAFEEQISYEDIELIRRDVLFDKSVTKEPICLIDKEQDREMLVKLIYKAVMQILARLQSVDISIAVTCKNGVQQMLGPCLKVLKLLSNLQFTEFDFRTQFLKDNGLKLLFEMSIIDSDCKAKRSNWATERHMDADLKEFIDNVWQPPKDLQKWYETLIMRQMFFQFKANFKRLDLQRDPCDYLISGPQDQSTVPEPEQSLTKRKSIQMPAFQHTKKNKSQQRPAEVELLMPSQKDMKRLLKKYEDLNEQSFSEFVKYYNSNIFQHVIIHFNVFLAACAKVCVLKKVPRVSASSEETKDQLFDLKIMLKKQIMKDILVDPNFNYTLPSKPQQRKDQVTRQQVEIVNQLLEIFINQTKGYRMEILKQFREKDVGGCLQVSNKNKLCLKNCERRIYFLDHVTILRFLVAIIVKNNQVTGLVLKHNDSKTVKFIVRNVYFLLSLQIEPDTKELQMNLQLPIERQTYTTSFFVHLLLLNHSSSVQDKQIKKDIGQLFIRQLAKLLQFKPQSDSLFSLSTQMLQKFSGIWLLSKFLLMKSLDINTKDALGAINQKKSKYQKLQRTHLVKQLIIQCQSLQTTLSVDQGSFALLEFVQQASIQLQTPDLFLFSTVKNQCLAMCVSVITKVLRLFENSQTLGQFFKQLGDQQPADYTNEPSDQDMDDEEESEEDYGSANSSSSGDFPSQEDGGPQLIDIMSDQDEEFGEEEGEEESDSWDFEEAEAEMTELLNSQSLENPQLASQQKQGPQPPASSSSSDQEMNDDQDSPEESSENSWEDENQMNQEQISYQDNHSMYEVDDVGDDYDSYDDGDSMNSRDGLSYEQDDDSEVDVRARAGVERRANLNDRRLFVLSQSQPRQVVPVESQVMSMHDHFSLDDAAILQGRCGLPMTIQINNEFQRIIQQNQDILQNFMPEQYMQLIDRSNKDGTLLGGNFIQAISHRKQALLQLKDRIKLTEGFYLQQITTFLAAPQVQVQQNQPRANSATAESDVVVINPTDFKGHMRQKQQQAQPIRPIEANNPLLIEGMDPLFMESLSAIGLQNIADSHLIHQQLTQGQQPVEIMQDLVRFIRSQTQQRRQDILRQIQSDQCRDLPSDIYTEMRELYVQDRESFMRVFNQQSQHQQRSQQQQLPRAQELPEQPRERLMSQDSITISLDLAGPADSQNQNKVPEQLETIRGDQFVQNFFIILQDMNTRIERDGQVVQCDRLAESILQTALIPSATDTALVQFSKIKGTVETAQTAFMNLDLSVDTQLTQSIKILHRIPNIRICLILKCVKQGIDEIQRARQHCQEQILCQQKKPYETKLVFSENQESMIPFANTVIGALKTTTQLQTTVEQETGREVMELVQALRTDSLICKFAEIIGLSDFNRSLIEYLLDLMLDFWDLCETNPWVIASNEQDVQAEIQAVVIEQIHQLLQPIIKEAKTKELSLVLPLPKLCSVFFNRSLPLVKKSMTQICGSLNELNDQQSIQVLQTFLETKLKQLLLHNMSALQQKLHGAEIDVKIVSTIETLKVTQQLKSLKSKNLTEESLLVTIFESAQQMIALEETKVEDEQLFVNKEEIKDLLQLLFGLCEYNLKLIFAKKDTQSEVQLLDQHQLKKKDDVLSFEQLLESHLSKSSPDFVRFRTIMAFMVENKKLINRFIQVNHSVINKELIQLAIMLPSVLDFDTKRAIWKTELKRMQTKYKSDRFQFQVRRDNCLQDSFAVMHSISEKQWRGRMQVEFQGEDGVDEGGVFKDWISQICKELFNEDMALFIKAASGSTYYPNPQSTCQPNYIDMFTFAGKFVGKALWDFQLLDCYFVKAFYKIILGLPLTYHDLEDYDSSLYKSLNWMIENQGVESVCSSFVETINYFGDQKEVELCEGGKDIAVTDDNKFQYVQAVANYRLYKAISTQIDAFLKGLYTVVPKSALKIFDNRELELLISGLQIIDIDDLRENTLYENYTAQSKPVQFLFEALKEFDNLERAEFIRFVTGSSKVPVEGFKGLRAVHGIQKFTVVRIPSSSQTRLPQSHTCMNQLDLPEYKDKETCKRMLLYAIKEGKGFTLA